MNALGVTTLDAVSSLFHGGNANVSWERALDGLSGEQAHLVPAGLPHSVAGIVAHVAYWQTYLLAVFAGDDPPAVEHAAQGWPDQARQVQPDSDPATSDPVNSDPVETDWEALKLIFFSGLDTLAAHARDEAFLELLDRKGRPRIVPLTSFAGHGLYHLGQVVTVRQLIGAWPPPGGGDTW